jgi:hypothetical protein
VLFGLPFNEQKRISEAGFLGKSFSLRLLKRMLFPLAVLFICCYIYSWKIFVVEFTDYFRSDVLDPSLFILG